MSPGKGFPCLEGTGRLVGHLASRSAWWEGRRLDLLCGEGLEGARMAGAGFVGGDVQDGDMLA